jgi:hypothetical protein
MIGWSIQALEDQSLLPAHLLSPWTSHHQDIPSASAPRLVTNSHTLSGIRRRVVPESLLPHCKQVNCGRDGMVPSGENPLLVRTACFRAQPDNLVLYTKDRDPILRSSLSIDSREQLSHQSDPNFSKARPDTSNKASPPFPSQSLECTNISQCLQLLNCASPGKVVEHICLDLSYNDVWELDRLQVAQELARRAPDLKTLQLKYFLSLQRERKVPGAIAEFAVNLTKLHPLLNSLTQRPSDDDLHVYYTFVTDDYKLGLNVPIALIPMGFPMTN